MLESPTFPRVTPHLGSVRKISKLTIPTKLNFGEILICLLLVPIWDEEIFVLISPGKLSIPGGKLEQGRGRCLWWRIARKDTYRGREGGTERARHVRVGGTAQGNTVQEGRSPDMGMGPSKGSICYY